MSASLRKAITMAAIQCNIPYAKGVTAQEMGVILASLKLPVNSHRNISKNKTSHIKRRAVKQRNRNKTQRRYR